MQIIYIDIQCQGSSNRRILNSLIVWVWVWYKYTRNSSKGCVLEVDIEYSKELREFHDGYSSAPDKIEIKKVMLPRYQLKIADLYNIPTSNVKKLVPKIFNKEKYVLHNENLQLYLRLSLKLTKKTLHIRIQSITMANMSSSTHTKD